MQDGVVSEITGAKASSSAMVREAGLMKERMVEGPTLIPITGWEGWAQFRKGGSEGRLSRICVHPGLRRF